MKKWTEEDFQGEWEWIHEWDYVDGPELTYHLSVKRNTASGLILQISGIEKPGDHDNCLYLWNGEGIPTTEQCEGTEGWTDIPADILAFAQEQC